MMAGLQRKMQRARLGVKLFNEGRDIPQPVKVHKDGGYTVLHPTRGWKHVCAKRARLYA